MRTIPGTDISVSALGLGTVKIGRDRSVKYPRAFTIPDDGEVKNLLAQARDLGINLLDTAPAYGNSEARLGRLLTGREKWVLCTKVGEEFSGGKSTFDFSGSHTRLSIERSLKRLNTDYLDIVLIHSDGRDEEILNHGGCLDTLEKCRRQGLIRAIGMSTKTIDGGILAASLMDIVMITYNLEQQDRAVLEYAREHNKGVLVKKGLMSGHAGSVRASLEFLFAGEGISSVIVGTINPQHLTQNVRLAMEQVGE